MIVTPSLKSGGLERVVSIIANEFSSDENFQVNVLVLGNSDVFYKLSDAVNIISPRPYILSKFKALRALRTSIWLRGVTKSLNVEFVLTFGEGYNSLVILSLFFLKIKIYAFNRASPVSNLKGYRGLINPFFYRFANKIVVQTKQAVELMREKYKGSKFEVIGNPFYLQKDSKSVERENIILNVGSFTGLKNQKALIKIFSELNEKLSWRLVFVGEGSKKKECIEYAKGLDLIDQIDFVGGTKEIDNFYAKAKIFAFTSLSEGFPNVIGEAMVHGIPVISFNCISGPRDLIENGVTGFLIEPNDERSYVNQLEKLCRSSALRKSMGINGSLKIRDYSIEKIMTSYYQLLGKV